MDPDSSTRLWPSAAFGATTDPLNVQHGAAGVLRVLTLAHEVSRDPGLREAVDVAARWIGRRVYREPRALPGLYFGRSGTAWALLEAGRTLGDGDLVSVAADLARRVPVRWPNPDVSHGVAGAGLTQLRFWECTGDDEFLSRACQAADSLVSAARRQGSDVLWPIPQDFPSGMAGVAHYGFAHGVAGVGTFLLAVGRATGSDVCLDLADTAAETLAAAATMDRGAAYWAAGPQGGRGRTNWCSGSSGVGTFLLRVWEHGRDTRYAELSERAAVAVRRSRWHAGTAQCHGLAGDGEFLLDLADALGDERYRDWAKALAVGLHVRHALRAGRVVFPDEMGNDVVADFGTGLSGVTAFLLRLQHRGPRLWLPDPGAGRRCPSGVDSSTAAVG
jgi:lantibiotic modifying enzyme